MKEIYFKDDDNQKNTIWNNEMPLLCSTDFDRLEFWHQALVSG